MSATICNIREHTKDDYIPPEFVFIDTSFLIHAFIPVPENVPDSPTSANLLCDQYLTYLKSKAKNQTVALFTCDNVINELFFYILRHVVTHKELNQASFSSHNDEYKRRNRNPVYSLFKDHPELISKYFSTLRYYYERIIEVPIAILDSEMLVDPTSLSISEQMNKIINDYQMLPSDALNVSIAIKAGIKDILVIDADYHSIEGINVHTFLSEASNKCSICV